MKLMNYVNIKKRFFIFLLVLVIGIITFIFGLGSTGLVDETPPLFASAGKAMSESGDWLTPKVNGILRFDKPPLFYWLMGMFYSLPGNKYWDSLGSLSARLPSALASLFLMLTISDTLFRWPQKGNENIYLPFIGALSFALSPLVLIWSRTAVSDSLLCGTLGISLLLFWRRIANGDKGNCIAPWICLGLGILTKGPVALVIVTLTLFFFFLTQRDWKKMFFSLHPIRGLFLTSFVSFPWFIIQFFKQGKVFWESFFGYHNLQRYTSVVNNHSEPWWFFFFILVLASLPFTPFLITGIYKTAKECFMSFRRNAEYSQTLYVFSLCWLLSILFFFSLSATKLPSYWLPATPPAAILICNSVDIFKKNRSISYPWLFTILILFGFSISFLFSNNLLMLINDPEMPNIANEIKQYGLIFKANLFFSSLTISAAIIYIFRPKQALLFLQIIFLLGQLFLMPSIRELADKSRQLPLRNISKQIISSRFDGEPLAMIGIRKPSLHFYSNQIVLYEPNSREGMVNLSERFQKDKRTFLFDKTNYNSQTFLVVIDDNSKKEKHWNNINRQYLDKYGVYNLWRIKRKDLEYVVSILKEKGVLPNWRDEKFEKF